MASDSEVKKVAREYIDSAMAERRRLGYAAKVSRKSYGHAVDQAAGVFEKLHGANQRGTAKKR
jgi:hypothetical protein